MAKYDFDIAVAFATQTDEGTYNSALDAITTSISGDPDGTDEGLVLGDAGSGIAESGLSLTIGRRGRPQSQLSGGFTRPISHFELAEVTSLTFAFPWVGSRRTPAGTPTDANAVPLAGVDAILESAGLVGAAWSGGGNVGHSYKFGSPNPISVLLWVSGFRAELLDCRANSLSISYSAGAVPIATVDLAVGSIKDPATYSAASGTVTPIPTTLDYGVQTSISAETASTVSNVWSISRGWTDLELAISPNVEEIGDSNATNGLVKEQTDRETTLRANLWSDDTSTAEVFEHAQAWTTLESQLTSFSWQTGTSMVDATTPAKAIQVLAPDPALVDVSPLRLGSKAGNAVNLIATSSTVNEELEIRFR